ncbi:hypothetical protein ES703_57465 [subsurface metagenome]
MKPFYQDNHNTIYCLDFRENDLPDECVQCVVTSPPYWGLRKYSGEQELIWGGDNNCVHQWVDVIKPDDAGQGHYTGRTRWQHIAKEAQEKGVAVRDIEPTAWAKGGFKTGFCSLCGAWKGAYGLEPTPEMYVQHTIEILREIRWVLRKDGVVFWNIGDSYATHASGGKAYAHNFRPPDVAIREGIDQPKPTAKSIGLKEKDLCLIPFRIAIAAQEDGWWVRSVIIWSKPNPMPESVTDRPTESHEYILMLTKSAKYYWDQEAVREEYSPTVRWGGDTYKGAVKKGTHGEDGGLDRERSCFPGAGRNIRSVWEFPTQPYPEAHFAVFPEKLPELCIKAATPEVGCCSKCGAPWVRITKPSEEYAELLGKDWNIQEKDKAEGKISGHHRKHDAPSVTAQYQTIGWKPSCNCNTLKPPVPSLVLDPFMGAGTTLKVAKKLNRKATGYEISQEYCQLSADRCRQQVLL